ncbi:hypothetical protein JAAARDRAFT_37705 [Jaapia argillacea MUCL 33604]|uniref:DUF6533 domain-containing protein n=1 Tax=Jaapia argillacea MUCL 33604 TaxID=933084 RepID=A0A067PJU2_9AGAM|nr:hypothetical protein JAAARDRAFT_37705 [Jaapia argillacea MUCL 33604]
MSTQGPSTGAQHASAMLAVNRSAAAALALLFYDILLTFDDEVHLIWSRPRSYTKFLYFYVRYMTLAAQISLVFTTGEASPNLQYTHYQCYLWEIWQEGFALSLIMAVDIILILRVHALYNGKKLVTSIICFFYIAEVVSMLTSSVLATPGMEYDTLCLITYSPPSIVTYGVASAVFQGILFSFTLYQFVVSLRQGWGRTRLVTLLMRDGTWAFFLIFSVMIVQSAVYLWGDPDYSGMLYCWLLTIFSFSGYRILLNLQSLSPSHRPSADTDITTSRITNTRMEFTTNFNNGRSIGDNYGGGSMSGPSASDDCEPGWELGDIRRAPD